jgi:hypothetical protein
MKFWEGTEGISRIYSRAVCDELTLITEFELENSFPVPIGGHRCVPYTLRSKYCHLGPKDGYANLASLKIVTTVRPIDQELEQTLYSSQFSQCEKNIVRTLQKAI